MTDEKQVEAKDPRIDIEAWFQKWFHSQPGFSDNNIIWDRLQAAKAELLAILKEE